MVTGHCSKQGGQCLPEYLADGRGADSRLANGVASAVVARGRWHVGSSGCVVGALLAFAAACFAVAHGLRPFRPVERNLINGMLKRDLFCW